MGLPEYFAKQYYWEETLTPYLQELGLIFDRCILISEVERHRDYIGFLQVNHDPNHGHCGIWFSRFVKIHVQFHNDADIGIDIRMTPIHMRKAIVEWRSGNILLDNRNEIQ